MPTNLASLIVVKRPNETGYVTVRALFSSKKVSDGDERDDARILRLSSREFITTADEADRPGVCQKIGLPDSRPGMAESSYLKLRVKRLEVLRKLQMTRKSGKNANLNFRSA